MSIEKRPSLSIEFRSAAIGSLLMLTTAGCDLGTSDLMSTDDLDRAWRVTDSTAPIESSGAAPSPKSGRSRSATKVQEELGAALFSARVDDASLSIDNPALPTSPIVKSDHGSELDGASEGTSGPDPVPVEI